MIGILNYGIGNPKAIARMYDRLGIEAEIVNSSNNFGKFGALIIPGVGSFDACISSFDLAGYREKIEDQIRKRAMPILGICVGAQMLGGKSDEGVSRGLSWMPIETKKIVTTASPVPHMGWNEVLFEGKSNYSEKYGRQGRFYFSHSYVIESKLRELILGKFNYEREMAAVIQYENFIAAQFHPEKSHIFGKHFLEWFASLIK
jgi:glutamine amidotransferase